MERGWLIPNLDVRYDLDVRYSNLDVRYERGWLKPNLDVGYAATYVY